MLECLRNIIYNGTNEQLEYLRRLADTYRLLFVLQFDPKLAHYFSEMAQELCIYVDTSILLPAMSELFLDPQNRRYTNLLVSASNAGISLIVNETVLSELAAHFRSIQRYYLTEFEKEENLYLSQNTVIYVDYILIRAYLYAKMNKHVEIETFKEFIESFVSWDMQTLETELVEWLKSAFYIKYEESEYLGLNIDQAELEDLVEELKKYKSSEAQARTDAKQLLKIYGLREKNNELGDGGIFGYKTWWLTSDIKTQRAFRIIQEKSSNRYNPYIRADYLYNYITLAPSRKKVDEVYETFFPTLLGVNISFHVPPELSQIIQNLMKAHKNIVNTPRFQSKLRRLNEELKSNPAQWDRRKLTTWFEEQTINGKNGS